MTELNMRHKELQDSLAEIRTELDKVSTVKKPAEKTKMLNDLEEKVSRARRDMKMVEMEVRVLDPDARNIWKGRLKGELAALKDITRDMEWARTSEGVQPAEKPVDPSQMTEANLIDYGNKLMNETNESAETAIRILNDTKEVGIETAAKLKAQTEQLNRVHDQAYEIDDTLTRATFIVRRMLRRTATDKYIWCMTFSILVLIIFIIVYKILRGDNIKVSTQDQWHH